MAPLNMQQYDPLIGAMSQGQPNFGATAKAAYNTKPVIAPAPLAPVGGYDLEKARNAIGSVESGNNYQARGPLVEKGRYAGERALGRYQVMPGNLPQWSQEVLGRVVTEDEFLANEGIQDAIFDSKFNTHGNFADDASTWHSGGTLEQAKARGATDGYTATEDYVNRANAALNGGASTDSLQGSSGTDSLTPEPVTERMSVIQQLKGGDVKGAVKNMFTADPNENPLQAGERYEGQADKLGAVAQRAIEQINSQNAPASWFQVAGALGAAGVEKYKRGKGEDAKAELGAQLKELLSSGKTDPKTLAIIASLDPELGRQLMAEQRGMANQIAIQDRGWARDDANATRDRGWAVEDREDEQQARIDAAAAKPTTPPALGEVEKQLRAEGLQPGTPEYSERAREIFDQKTNKGANAGALTVDIGADGTISVVKPEAGTAGAAGTAAVPEVGADGTIIDADDPDNDRIRTIQDGEILDTIIPGSQAYNDLAEEERRIVRKRQEDWIKGNTVLNKIDQALDDTSFWSSGAFGQVASNFGGTPATDLASTIGTIQANLGFDALQKMRDNSPTGGALGQVTERELGLLQSTQESLDTLQSPGQLKENLQALKDQYRAILTGENYEAVMGFPPPNGVVFAPSTIGGGPEGGAPAPATTPPPAPTPEAAAGTLPVINSQAEYDALPPGTEYVDSNGTKARKR